MEASCAVCWGQQEFVVLILDNAELRGFHASVLRLHITKNVAAELVQKGNIEQELSKISLSD